MKKTLFIAMFIVAALVLVSGQSYAVSGHCANCHTMHNSQNGANVTGTDGPGNAVLLKWTCLGCHTTTETNQNFGSIPRVSHYGTTDLAGGNFNYVGGVANQTKGHNVVGVVTQTGTIANDTLLATAPGGTQAVPVTCAGTNGCHGLQNGTNEMASISGAHHTNNPVANVEVDGGTLGTSYRFLNGIKGAEVENRENSSASNHNEYYSNGTADQGGISKDLCGRCHPDFHNENGNEGTGAWTRHPIDFALNGGNNLAGNYGANGGANTYDYTVPVGRTTAPAAISDAANVGDTVMCLSCHKAHGTAYPDMLRWNYSSIVAGSSQTTGCNKCHAK